MMLPRISALFVSAALALAISAPVSDLHAQKGKSQAKESAQESILSAIERLGSPDFDTRRKAADELAERGKSAVGALKAAIEKSGDPELRWQARRVLRRIERGRAAPVRRFERVEREPRVDSSKGDEKAEVEKRRTERSDKLSRVRRGDTTPRRRRSGGFFEDGEIDFPRFDFDFGFGPAFPGMDRDFGKRIQKQIEDMFGKADAWSKRMPGAGAMPGQSKSQSLKVEVGEDGVRVEELTNEDGDEKRKVYSAKSMKELLEKYPHLKGRVGGGAMRFGRVPDFGRFFGGRGFRMDDFGAEVEGLRERMRKLEEQLRSGRMRDADPFRRLFPDAVPSRKPVESKDSSRDSGPRLGVTVRDEIPSSVRAYLGLPAGVGLWVESVVDGSLAAKVGLAPGDIVTQIGSKKIRSAADVRQALMAKGDHVVRFIRKGASKRAKLKR